MSAILKALDELKFRIPQEVLKVVFSDDLQNWRMAPVSIDEMIMEKVIRPRVLIDANLVGGQQIVVPLNGLAARYTDTYNVVYEVPAERLAYREIMSVLSVSYMPYSSTFNSLGYGMGGGIPTGMSDMGSVAQRVSDSISNIPVVSNATVDLIGFNTILVRDQNRISNSYQLRCVVGNTENLSNINPRSYIQFSKLCELAVKAYIYNRMLIRIDTAFLQGGQSLGAMKDYIESLADSNENYQTYLREVWQATALMNDSMAYGRLLRIQMNPTI